MKEYVERALAVQELEVLRQEYEMHDDCDELVARRCRDAISALPAADVVEVRHGRWIPSESDFDDDDTLFDVEDWCDWQCSVCHEDICYEDPMERRFLPKFCPNCGARMDKEDEHETD